MKKISVFLALVFVVLCLTSCVNFQNGTRGIWSVQKTTDEFGDVIADSQDFISASVQGSYENEEVTNSQLNVSVNLKKRSDFNHYIIELQLTENNATKIQYKEDSYKLLKTKVGEETQEFYLSLEESSGKLTHGNEIFYSINCGGDYIFSNLYNGKDVKCVITEYDSVLYSFELKSDNFKALCDANGFTEGAGDITVRESVNLLFHDKGIRIDESCECLINNYETFDVVKTEELKELLNGKFLMICLTGNDFCPWLLKEYSAAEKTMDNLLKYDYAEWKVKENFKYGVPKYRDGFHGYDRCRDEAEFQGYLRTINIEDNLITGEYSYKQEIRKITDNIFISTVEEYEPITYYYIFIKYNESLVNTVEYAQENYIQEIPY